MQGKIFINNNLTNGYNLIHDAYKIGEMNEFAGKIKEKIDPTRIADRIEEARAVINLNKVFNSVGFYSDNSIAGRLDIILDIADKKGNILFSETFFGGSPSEKIYKRSNEYGRGATTGSYPTGAALNYMNNLIRTYQLNTVIDNPDETSINTNIGSFVPKSKSIAILLAVFFGLFTWCYTYKTDYKKFWINLCLDIVTFGFWIPVARIWAIVNSVKRPENFYSDYI